MPQSVCLMTMISARAHQPLADRKRADLVVGHHAAGVANQVRVALHQPEQAVGIDPRIHAGHDRDLAARRARLIAVIELLGVARAFTRSWSVIDIAVKIPRCRASAQ